MELTHIWAFFLLAGSRKKTSSSNGNKHGCQSARTFKSFIYRGNMKFTVTQFIISPLSPVTPPPPSRHSGGAAGGEVLRSRIEYFPRIPCSPPPCSLKQLQYLILRLRSETFSRMTRRLRGAGRSSEERSWILLQFSCTWDSSVCNRVTWRRFTSCITFQHYTQTIRQLMIIN